MTVMKTNTADTPQSENGNVQASPENRTEMKDNEKPTEKDGNIFSADELPKVSEVEVPETAAPAPVRKIKITPLDKASFLDAIIGNRRFTKDYTLFGGKVKLVIRSLTNDEVNAMSAWILKKGTSDASSLLSGRYRKYLTAAMVAHMNGIDMPPLEEPLYETLNADGKTTTPPGWIGRSDYWDNMSIGLFNAVMNCIDDFDAIYAELCRKAEDANFWNPDTP